MKAIIDEQAMENIILEHILKMRQLEEEACGILKARVANLITRLLLRINQNLKNMEDIKSYDRLYFHMEAMNLDYENFLNDLNEKIHYIEDSEVSDLFISIRAMVLSFLDTVPVKNDNPITYERMVLISAAILRIKQYWMGALETATFDCKLGNNVSEEQLDYLMTQQVRDFFFQGMFTTSHMLEESLLMLSNFEEGKKYQGFIQEQVRALDDLVLNQRPLVEAGLQTELESKVVMGLMDALTTIRNLSVEVLQDLEDQPKHLGSASELVHMEQLEDILNAYGQQDQEAVDQLNVRINQIKDESVSELQDHMEREIDEIIKSVAHKGGRDSAEVNYLCGKMVGIFHHLVTDMNKLDALYATEEARTILEGIRTTMALKLESMEEMHKTFPMDKARIAHELEDLMVGKKHQCLSRTEEILTEILTNQDTVLVKTQKKFYEGVQGVGQKHVSFDMNFLKNNLLFELRTYEELIEHSLKKLIELEGDRVKGLTELMLGTMSSARDLLLKHEIELIMVKPHDKFLTRLHEAILAEEVEGFEAGEIVKSINVGYKKKDSVIIRASVMAAR